MLFRLKKHLIWTPEAFPLIRQSSSKIEVTGTNRSDGGGQPPERIDFHNTDARHVFKSQEPTFLYKTRTEQQQKAETVPLSLSNPFLSLKITIHHLPHHSNPFSHQVKHLLQVLSPDSESLRRGALGRTDHSKLHQRWIFGLLKIKPSNQPSSYLYTWGRNSLTLFMLLEI